MRIKNTNKKLYIILTNPPNRVTIKLAPKGDFIERVVFKMKTAEQMKKDFDKKKTDEQAKIDEKIKQMPEKLAEKAIESLDEKIKQLGSNILYNEIYEISANVDIAAMSRAEGIFDSERVKIIAEQTEKLLNAMGYNFFHAFRVGHIYSISVKKN